MASYFDRELTSTEALALAQALNTDRQKAARLVAEYEIDRLLTLRARPAEESRIDAIVDQIQREADSFVDRVVRDIRHEASQPKARIRSWVDSIAQLFWRPGWALLTVVVGFLCCAWFFYFGITTGEPRLALAANSVVEVLRNGALTPVGAGFVLRAGDVLHVAGTNSVTINFAPEQTAITNWPGAEMKLLRVAGAKRFALNAGRIGAAVARQRTFRPLVIVTPEAEARVLGTRLTLMTETNATQLEVIQGEVKFTRVSDGKAVRVRAGNHALAAANSPLAALPTTGRILREYWTNLANGSLVTAGSTLNWKRSLVVPPDGHDYLPRFESAPLRPGLRFSERIRGYIQPPKSGLYRFALGTVHVETVLHLSRTDRPQDMVQIAFRGADGAGPSIEEITPVPLQAGRQYYVEVIHESGGGDDHLTVLWQPPGGDPEIVPGEFLSPAPVQEKKGQR